MRLGEAPPERTTISVSVHSHGHSPEADLRLFPRWLQRGKGWVISTPSLLICAHRGALDLSSATCKQGLGTLRSQRDAEPQRAILIKDVNELHIQRYHITQRVYYLDEKAAAAQGRVCWFKEAWSFKSNFIQIRKRRLNRGTHHMQMVIGGLHQLQPQPCKT